MNVPEEVRQQMARAVYPIPNVGINDALAIVDAALSALEAAGWKCVPMKPTEPMLSAGLEAYWPLEEFVRTEGPLSNGERIAASYAAMLTASRHKEKQDG